MPLYVRRASETVEAEELEAGGTVSTPHGQVRTQEGDVLVHWPDGDAVVPGAEFHTNWVLKEPPPAPKPEPAAPAPAPKRTRRRAKSESAPKLTNRRAKLKT